MTSASSSSARSLFAESKQRLAERVQVNMNNIASLTRQIQRGSKSNEIAIEHRDGSPDAKREPSPIDMKDDNDVLPSWGEFMQHALVHRLSYPQTRTQQCEALTILRQEELLSKAAREMAVTENLMESSEENLKKMQLIAVHMGYQFENIHKSAQMLVEINEQVSNMQR